MWFNLRVRPSPEAIRSLGPNQKEINWMIKMVFMLYRKPGLTRDECLAAWTGDQHLSFVPPMKSLGVLKYVQNPVTSPQRDGAPDGVGEYWFEDAAAMERVMNSPEMAAGFEDAKRFADLERTYGLVVDESVVVE